MKKRIAYDAHLAAEELAYAKVMVMSYIQAHRDLWISFKDAAKYPEKSIVWLEGNKLTAGETLILALKRLQVAQIADAEADKLLESCGLRLKIAHWGDED